MLINSSEEGMTVLSILLPTGPVRTCPLLLALPACWRIFGRRAQEDVVRLQQDEENVGSVEQGIFGVLFTVAHRRAPGLVYMVARYAPSMPPALPAAHQARRSSALQSSAALQ